MILLCDGEGSYPCGRSDGGRVCARGPVGLPRDVVEAEHERPLLVGDAFERGPATEVVQRLEVAWLQRPKNSARKDTHTKSKTKRERNALE